MFFFRVITIYGDFFYEASSWSEAKQKAEWDGRAVKDVSIFMPNGEQVDVYMERRYLGEP